MSTDFSKNSIGLSGGIKITLSNSPLDIRTRIETIEEVSSIPLPFVGMIFYVIAEEKFYKVVSLKGKQVGPAIISDMLIDRFEELIPEQDEVDLSHLAVKEDMEAAHAEMREMTEQEIERAKAREDEIAAELKALIDRFEELKALVESQSPVEPDNQDPIYYGYMSSSEADVLNYADITISMVQKAAMMKSTKEVLSGKVNLGDGVIPEGQFLLVAVPSSLGKVVKKDDGLGGKVEFSEEVCGANGVIVDFDGVEYQLFGELTLTDFECFIYMV